MKYSITLLVLLISLVSCKSDREKKSGKIAAIEHELKTDTTGKINFTRASEIIKLYEEYVAAFPDDTLSPGYLFKAADVSAHIHNTEYAINLYHRVIKEYPKYRKVPQAWFYIGFLYDNELKNYPEARNAYETLLNKFPEYEQRTTVEWLLANLGKSDIELAKQLQSGQTNSADSSALEVK